MPQCRANNTHNRETERECMLPNVLLGKSLYPYCKLVKWMCKYKLRYMHTYIWRREREKAKEKKKQKRNWSQTQSVLWTLTWYKLGWRAQYTAIWSKHEVNWSKINVKFIHINASDSWAREIDNMHCTLTLTHTDT